ncbi:MAG TPA: response regulator transcription factor, partial [Syntrophomonas sp.]|nr:response regulator transcription factor [Syntrophomonas sp.]
VFAKLKPPQLNCKKFSNLGRFFHPLKNIVCANIYTGFCLFIVQNYNTIACLERSAAEGEKADASLYSSYALAFSVITRYMTGVPLQELKEYIANHRSRRKRLTHYLANHIYAVYENHIRWLEEGVAAGDEVSLAEADRNKKLFADTIKLNGDMIRLQRLYLEGKTREAYYLAEEIEAEVSLHQGFLLNVEALFYSILSRLAVHRDLSGVEKRRNRRFIKRQLHELRYWVRVYPDNHNARYLLARAEYDVQFAGGKHAPGLYREAMEFAQHQGNLALEALASLLTAGYHRDDRKLSAFYAAEAASLYRKWGAAALADAVAARWKPDTGSAEAGKSDFGPVTSTAGETFAAENLAGLREAAATLAEPPVAKPYADDRDILSHLGRIEEMNEEEGYLYLLDLLIRRGGIDYCAVFFEKTEDMYLKYEQRKTSGPQIHREPINMNHLSGLPHKIIRYAARTETKILLETKERTGLFANDPYLAAEDQLSLACLPLRYAGVLAGIIYLEKTGEEGIGGTLPSLVKGFVPLLLAKKVNGNAIFTEPKPESPAARKTEKLTGREVEVLRMVAEGMSNSEISEKLYITLGTVRNHLSNIYAKLEVDNRVKAVMKAKELKIIHL